MTEPSAANRRPLASRNIPIFQWLAEQLVRIRVAPNHISFASMIFAAGAAVALAGTSHVTGPLLRLVWLLAALGIQMRLLANMLDGMVAVEGGRGGPTGELWNEAPDRVADVLTFIGAGYAMGSDPLLGFGAGIVAVLVAYVRALGASVGAGQIFLGPQAKPQRMAVLTGACVASAIFPQIHLVVLALWIVLVGGAFTATRRLARIARFLKEEKKA